LGIIWKIFEKFLKVLGKFSSIIDAGLSITLYVKGLHHLKLTYMIAYHIVVVKINKGNVTIDYVTNIFVKDISLSVRHKVLLS